MGEARATARGVRRRAGVRHGRAGAGRATAAAEQAGDGRGATTTGGAAEAGISAAVRRSRAAVEETRAIDLEAKWGRRNGRANIYEWPLVPVALTNRYKRDPLIPVAICNRY